MDFSVLNDLDEEGTAARDAKAARSTTNKKAEKQAQQAARRAEAARKAALKALAACEETAAPSTMHDKMHRRSAVAELSSGADEQDGNLLLPPSQLSQDEAARRMAARAPAAGCLDLRNSSTDRPICRFFAKGAHCREGDRCRFVHERSTSPAKAFLPKTVNVSSLMVQSPKLTLEHLKSIGQDPTSMPYYKTVMCNYWRSMGICPRGDKCTYAHGQHEKRPQVRPDGRPLGTKPAPHDPPQAAPSGSQHRQPGHQNGQLPVQLPLPAPPPAVQQPLPQQNSGNDVDLLDMLFHGSDGPTASQLQSQWDQTDRMSAAQAVQPQGQVGRATSQFGQKVSAPDGPMRRPYRPAGVQQMGPGQRPDPRPPLPPPPYPPQYQLPPDHPRNGSHDPRAPRKDQMKLNTKAKQKQGRKQADRKPVQSRFELLSFLDDGGDAASDEESAPAAEASQSHRDAVKEHGEDDGHDIFNCALTLEVMTDPVVCADGHSYERKVIEQWLENNDTSPLTGLKLAHKQVVPNHAVAHAIKQMYGQRSS
mmetsp:Transcript_11966/g.35928  ORF Transcript_11966/g.35928 Transcript_11966/m.35928 type:complete len:534 (+) Transcript_11966:201-1802(+)